MSNICQPISESSRRIIHCLKLLIRPTVAILLVTIAPTSWALPDCDLGQQYQVLANRAGQALEQRKQMELLEKAMAACESYHGYMELGEVAAAFANSSESHRAADAFIRAYELADDEKKQASAVFSYAQLLHHSNQSQQALRYIYAARNLDPNNEKIAALAERIAATTQQVTEEQIVRGFGQLALTPLKLREYPEDGSVGSGAGSGTINNRPSVNIPLTFEFGTIRLSPDSIQNVRIVATTLANHYSDKTILFIGHADERGTHDYNLSLSISRAEAIRQEVTRLQPQLLNQISIAGKGEEQLLSNGNTEADHQVNRRLEIIIE